MAAGVAGTVPFFKLSMSGQPCIDFRNHEL